MSRADRLLKVGGGHAVHAYCSCMHARCHAGTVCISNILQGIVSVYTVEPLYNRHLWTKLSIVESVSAFSEVGLTLLLYDLCLRDFPQ